MCGCAGARTCVGVASVYACVHIVTHLWSQLVPTPKIPWNQNSSLRSVLEFEGIRMLCSSRLMWFVLCGSGMLAAPSVHGGRLSVSHLWSSCVAAGALTMPWVLQGIRPFLPLSIPGFLAKCSCKALERGLHSRSQACAKPN